MVAIIFSVTVHMNLWFYLDDITRHHIVSNTLKISFLKVGKVAILYNDVNSTF